MIPPMSTKLRPLSKLISQSSLPVHPDTEGVLLEPAFKLLGDGLRESDIAAETISPAKDNKLVMAIGLPDELAVARL